MKETPTLVLTAILIAALVGVHQPAPAAQLPDGRVRFETVDVYVDSGGQSLAAYQFEMAAEVGDVKIVGLEGGEHPAFRNPPYYDPAALMQNRVIVAAFNTGRDLPRGRTRVARLHVQITGDRQPEFAIRLDAAGNAAGARIPATIIIGRGGAGGR